MNFKQCFIAFSILCLNSFSHAFSISEGALKEAQIRGAVECLERWQSYQEQENSDKNNTAYNRLMGDIEAHGSAAKALCGRELRRLRALNSADQNVLLDYVNCGYRLENHLSLQCVNGLDVVSAKEAKIIQERQDALEEAIKRIINEEI